jgi:6-pyruvoyltetrahydropterin/6-carboxytetrahydropterin synthase
MSRWIVHSRAEFTAAHALSSYLGQPEERHSHRWQVAIRVATPALNDEGYAIDFHAVHGILEQNVTPLDGTDLSLHPEIGTPTPSAERVAEVLAGQLRQPLTDLGGTLLSVSVWEGPDNRVDLTLED